VSTEPGTLPRVSAGSWTKTAALFGAVMLAGCHARLITGTGVDSARVSEIQDAIARLRGMPFRPPARIEVLDGEAMRATELRLRESDDSLHILRIWSVIDRAFGDPWKHSPAQAARELPRGTSFGVYSPSDDVLFLSRPRLQSSSGPDLRGFVEDGQALAEIVITHELAHAWQHRHFPLLFAPTSDVDRWDTQHALLEGDAEVTTLALTQGSVSQESVRAYLRLRYRMAESAGQHPHENRDWQLRYDRATRYLSAVVRREGWKGLNALQTRPPSSTAAILQTDFGDQLRQAAVARDEEGMTCPRGWRLAVDTAVGAFGAPSLLKLGSPPPLAIAGWRYDRLQICLRDGSEDFIMYWRTRWDSDAAATAFYEAALAHLQRRHPGAAPAMQDRFYVFPNAWLERRGRLVVMADSNLATEPAVTVGSSFK
jgi:hypothetical protein